MNEAEAFVDDEQADGGRRRQCEEEKRCQIGDCPKGDDVESGSEVLEVNGQWREILAWYDEVVSGVSVCDDEKVSEGDGVEVSDCEEQISWLQHNVTGLGNVGMAQMEWNDEHVVVEGVME
eukprot:s1115_g23.t1